MTYETFLLAILLPGLVLAAGLLAVRYQWTARDRLKRDALTLAGLVVLAVGYTTPWDRWLILHTVWWYRPGSIAHTIGQVPVDEYLFMIGLTLLYFFWTVSLTSGLPAPEPAPADGWRRPVCAAGWLALASAGAVAAATDPRALYLGAILVWFGIPLAVQAAAGADVLRAARRQRLLGLSVTPVVWVADAVAIRAGAWQIGSAHTVGVVAFGLPLEEAVFYLVVNLLVVNSVAMLSAPGMRQRAVGWAGAAARMRREVRA